MVDTSLRAIAVSLLLFVAAGLCEIGGGWLVWQAFRGGKPAWWAMIGASILILYGWIPTCQNASFGRVYAVYGGFFIVLSLTWARVFDGIRPDRFDVTGSLIALAGVSIMMYAPRA